MDAYTIRKVLPRLLVAVIFINLSWPILQYLVELTNIVGVDVRSIIYTPFSSIGKGSVVTIGGGATTVGALIGGSAFALGLIGVGGLVTMAFLAVAVGFIVLLLRQVIIMMLIVSAPLAIACYVLPATERYWKFWRDTLIAMLVMFPIISAFIAMGRVGAVVMYNASMYSLPAFNAMGRMFGVPMHTATLQSLPPLVKQLGAATLWFLSLPVAVYVGIKASGRASAALHGAINGKLHSGLGGGKGKKAGKQGGFAERLKTRFREGNFHAPPVINRIPIAGVATERTARAFGRVTAGAALGVKGHFGVSATAKGRAALYQSRNAAAARYTQDPSWSAVKDDDDAVTVGANYASATEARRALRGRPGWDRARINDAVAAVESSIGFGRAQQLAFHNAYVDTGTAYANLREATETDVNAAGGSRNSLRRNVGYRNAIAKTKGRQEASPGYTPSIAVAQALQDGRDVGDGVFDVLQVRGATENGNPSQFFATAKPQTVANVVRSSNVVDAVATSGTMPTANYSNGMALIPISMAQAAASAEILDRELSAAQFSAGSGESAARVDTRAPNAGAHQRPDRTYTP